MCHSSRLGAAIFCSLVFFLYPNGVFASHLIGLAESEDKKLVGIMGLEKVFNKQLSGRDGINNTATDSYGVQLPGSSKKKRWL